VFADGVVGAWGTEANLGELSKNGDETPKGFSHMSTQGFS